MSEIIVISFWSGRTEKYLVNDGTIEALRNMAGARKFQDSIYRDQLPADWYMGFYRENMDGKLAAFNEVDPYDRRFSHFYVLDRTN
jgi:hypothetical protein